MASNPTTKSQVQAYQFVLRRMESALVRKDAVMLHDPMGSHKRATVAGVALAMIGVIGFLVWGLFSGKGTVPGPGTIVIGKDTGSVYVVTADNGAQGQKRLIPMLNMASAKLLVMAQGGAQGQNVAPQQVKEAALAELPRSPRTGIPNAPAFLPAANNIADPAWAICDSANVDRATVSQLQDATTNVETTVIGGESNHGPELGQNQALFVRDQTSNQLYLVYHTNTLQAVQQPASVVKASVNANDPVVMDLFGLNRTTPRSISTNMLNAIPTVSKLTTPQVPGQDEPVNYMANSSKQHKVGDVVKRGRESGGGPDYFVLLPTGKQQITAAAAEVINAAKYGAKAIPDETNAITESPDAKSGFVAANDFPNEIPRPVPFSQASTSCLSWASTPAGVQNITVTVANGSPVAGKEVLLAQATSPGPHVSKFYMPPGKGAVVRAIPSQGSGNAGPLFLVSDQGVAYGIKDIATAKGLGIINSDADIRPAPAGILSTLPTGAFLDPAEASMTYDSIPVGKGGVNRPPQQKGGAAAAG